MAFLLLLTRSTTSTVNSPGFKPSNSALYSTFCAVAGTASAAQTRAPANRPASPRAIGVGERIGKRSGLRSGMKARESMNEPEDYPTGRDPGGLCSASVPRHQSCDIQSVTESTVQDAIRSE